MRKIVHITRNRLIIFVYSILFVLLAIVGIKGIDSQRKIDKSYGYIVDSTIYELRLLRQTRENAEKMQATVIDEVFHGTLTKITELNISTKECEANLDNIGRYSKNEEESLLFNKMIATWQNLKQSLDSFLNLRTNEEKTIAYYRSKEKKNYDNFYHYTNQLSDSLYNEIQLQDQKADDYVSVSEIIVNSLIGAIIVILIFLGILVIKDVKKINRHNRILTEKDKMLSESKHLYKELFDKSPLPKWVCDRHTLQFYEVNDKAVQSYGYTREEFLNLTVFDIRQKQDHEKPKECIQHENFSKDESGVRNHVKRNGEIIQAEIALDEIIYKGKEALLIAVNDVTEKIKAQEVIRESEQLYRSLFNNSPVFIWVSEVPTLRLLDVNETAIKHFGYSRQEFLSMTAFDLLVEEDRKIVKERLKGPTNGFLGNDRHRKKNGEIINVEIRVHPINYNGKEAGLVIGVDVTEKMKADEELKHSEEIYRLLFNNSPLPKWVCDPITLKIYEVNEAAIELYGYSKSEFLGLSVFDILLKEEHEKAKDFIQNSDFSKTVRAVRRHIKKNGDIFHVEIILHEILYRGKKQVLVTINDISEKLKAEEKLRQEEEFYRTIMQNNSDLQFVTNDKREIIYASPSVYNNFSFQENEIIGKRANDFWHADDIESSKEKISELMGIPGKTIQLELRVQDREKVYRWCAVRISNQLHNAAVKGYVSTYSEITERKLAEEKIRSSEELYRSLFSKNPLPTFVVDKENLQFLEVNDMAVELYGYSREEFLKLSVFDLRTTQDYGYLSEVVSKKIVHDLVNYHVTHVRKNGEEIIVDVALETINYKGKEAFLAIAKDITKNLQLEKQLNIEKVNKQIEITKAAIQGQEKERNELGKELHDNVNQVLATAKLYLESAIVTPAKQIEFMEKAKNLVNSGINEIRKISKSLVPPSLGDLTLADALKELAEPIKLTKKKIRLNISGLNECKLCNDLKISVYRIVQEQLNNIIKYAEASEICISVSQTESELALNISDNGKGFVPAKRRNGIGITNMINRANIFNGKIIIDSSPGNGCRVNANFKLNGKNLQLPFYANSENNQPITL